MRYYLPFATKFSWSFSTTSAGMATENTHNLLGGSELDYLPM